MGKEQFGRQVMQDMSRHLAVASSREDKTSASLARFSVFSTMPAPKKKR